MRHVIASCNRSRMCTGDLCTPKISLDGWVRAMGSPIQIV